MKNAMKKKEKIGYCNIMTRGLKGKPIEAFHSDVYVFLKEGTSKREFFFFVCSNNEVQRLTNNFLDLNAILKLRCSQLLSNNILRA